MRTLCDAYYEEEESHDHAFLEISLIPWSQQWALFQQKVFFSCPQTDYGPACVACQSVQYNQSFCRSLLSLARMGISLTWQRTTGALQQSDGQITHRAAGKDLKEKIHVNSLIISTILNNSKTYLGHKETLTTNTLICLWFKCSKNFKLLETNPLLTTQVNKLTFFTKWTQLLMSRILFEGKSL